MVARCRTVAFQGIDVMPVDVQVQLSNGLPAFAVVGLADKAVGESRERVRGALGALGLSLPPKRITVNLAPADLPKEGSHYDLPIALALLAAMNVLPPDALEGFVALGELGLDGALGTVTGVLPAAIAAHGEDRGLICPAAQGSEAAWAGDAERVVAAPTLLALINHFRGSQVLSPPSARIFSRWGNRYSRNTERKAAPNPSRSMRSYAPLGHALKQSGLTRTFLKRRGLPAQ